MTILIVDDDAITRKRLELLAGDLKRLFKVHVRTCSTPLDAIQILQSQPIHLLLLDKEFGETENFENGILLIPEFLAIRPSLQILVISGSDDDRDIIQALTLGAFGYLTKTSHDDLIRLQIRRALRMAYLSQNALNAYQNDSKNQPLTYQELLIRPLDLIGEDFPGVTSFVRSLTKRLLEEAKTKFHKNKDIAKALGLSESRTSTLLSELDDNAETKPLAVSRGETHVH